jgi:hypothetical protein
MRLYIPRDREAHGIQIIGVKGTRKSSAVRRLVYQAYDRGWPCIFLDRKSDYLEEFYQPNDYLINFGDTRGVRWMTSREAIDEPHAMPMAEGAYPDGHNRIFFFQDHARAIFSYLIGVHKPSTSELARMFAYPKLLDAAVKGTEHAETLSRNSPEQRQGILGTLNHLGRTLRWMPDADGDREFSVSDWCKSRKGSIFLSSSPYSFPALRPLHSLIADMLLLGVQTHPGPALFVGDEIGVFKRLPQLEEGAAMIRSSGVVVVLAYQGYAQLVHTYGEEMADSISSNNYLNIMFRTTSPKSAEYSSKILGMPAQIDRINESRSAHSWTQHRHNYSSQRVMDAPVTAGEIQSLEDGEGYMSCAGRITKIQVDYLEPVIRAPRLLERVVKTPAPMLADPVPRKSRYTQTTLPMS